MLRLEMSYGGKVRHFHLRDGEVRLGSAPDNDLVLALPGVSRHHALLRQGSRGLELLDLGSKNGLVSGGRRRNRLLLAPGGEAVQIGKVLLSVEEISTSDAHLGLELGPGFAEAGAPAGSSPPLPSTAEITARAWASSPEAGLRLVRRIERSGTGTAGRRSGLVAEACRTLGAKALLAFRLDRDGEMVLVESEGGPDDRELERIAQAARGLLPTAERTAGAPPQARERYLLAIRGRREPSFLAACFATAEAAGPSWRMDLFSYLADHLVEAGKSAAAAAPPAEEPDPLDFPAGMVPGTSPSILALYDEIRAAAKSHLDVLLLGETGTGKELFARLIHASGPTAKGPFLPLSAPAIPAELLESELFGVVGRVATGVDPRAGLFDLAQGGTVLLDEIGDLSLALQTRLLRFLQEREIRPLGGLPKNVSLRVISATNRDLERMVEKNTFREDLYFRLRSLCFRIPPLRERGADLPALALAFAADAAERNGKRVGGISRKAVALLLAHRWPGNIRELRYEIEQAVLRCPNGGHLESRHFSLRPVAELPAAGPIAAHSEGEPAEGPGELVLPAANNLQHRIEALESSAIAAALDASGGNKTKAAQVLGLSRYGLSLKLKRLASRKKGGP